MSKKNLPPLIALRTFEAAARHASFKQAAEELCVTPSTVSHQVQKLEDWMGVQLFRRLNRKVILTDAGRTYFFTISKAFDEMSTVTGLVSKRHQGAASPRKLKLFADAGFIECWLGPRLDRLQSILPDVQLDIAFGQDIEDYLRGDADVAIHFGKGAWPEFQSVLLRTGYEFPVCSPKLLGGDTVLSRPSDLAAFTLLHESDTSGWTHWLAQAGVTHPGVLSGPIFPSTQAIFNKVFAGQGIALGDDIVAADLLYSGDLVKPIGKVRKSSQSLYFLQMKYGDDTEASEVFRTWLLDELSDHRRQTEKLRLNETFVLRP
ncbi:MAG: LysR family transcriptional regulator [Roseobacter sp.]